MLEPTCWSEATEGPTTSKTGKVKQISVTGGTRPAANYNFDVDNVANTLGVNYSLNSLPYTGLTYGVHNLGVSDHNGYFSIILFF